MSALTFDGPGIFRFNTAIMHLYVEYEFEVVVSKGDRSSLYKQQVIVKEGNPPEFYIESVWFCSLLSGYQFDFCDVEQNEKAHFVLLFVEPGRLYRISSYDYIH